MLTAGIDIGTSGVRAVAFDTARGSVVADAALALPEGTRTADGGHLIDDTDVVDAALRALGDVAAAAGTVEGVAVAGAAGTLCFRDADGNPCAAAVAYDDARFGSGVERVRAWRERVPGAVRVVPIADAVLEALGAEPGHTDWTNALKLGWDPRDRCWPAAARHLERERFLPGVEAPGAAAGGAATRAATGATLVRGATDSCAMHLAAAGLTPGAWSVSLGSTVTWKVAVPGSQTAVLDRLPLGAYAHRITDDTWLAAAASNTGGAVLTALESGADLEERDRDARIPTGYAAYPLARPGERFPVADPRFAGFGVPLPADGRFHGALLEGVAFVIRLGVERLAAAGLPPPQTIHLTGGGARSATWMRVIADVLRRPVIPRPDAGPALGAALLAAAGAQGVPVNAVCDALPSKHHRAVEPNDSNNVERMATAYQAFVRQLLDIAIRRAHSPSRQ